MHTLPGRRSVVPQGRLYTRRALLPAYVRLQDYFMFFYTFSARAPHVVTRMSHAVIPMHSGQPHAGVYFPTGLDALGPTGPLAAGSGAGLGATGVDKYLLSYGVNDDTGLVLMLTKAEIEGLLRPVWELTPEAYEFCSLYDSEAQ
jgi:hypothetical protein